MAQRRSKKKRSGREDFMLKEQSKVEGGMLDEKTIMRLGKFFTHNIISRLMYMVGRGKEADTYIAQSGLDIKKGYVAVKIFRIETSSFGARIDYIDGDPRFGKIKPGMFNLVNEWCKKEFSNLKIANEAKVHCPKPYMFNGNILAMEMIGEDDVPAPQMRKIDLEEPDKVLDIVLGDMRKMYQNNLVHEEMSEYNILIKGGTPYIIDFGQAVVLGHPNAEQFLKRDVKNILYYFYRKYGIERSQIQVMEYITKGK